MGASCRSLAKAAACDKRTIADTLKIMALPRRTAILTTLALSGAAFAAAPAGQPLAPRADDGLLRPVSLARDLRRVEPGVSDTGPLSTSLRTYSAELGVPDAFRDVYRLQSGPRAGQFARVSGSGGVVAVYPRGQYTLTGDGLRADIPNDTVFYIDGVPGGGGNGGGSGGEGGLSARIDPRVGGLIATGPDASCAPHAQPLDPRTEVNRPHSVPSVTPFNNPDDDARSRATAREQAIQEREAEYFDRGTRLFTDSEFRAQRVSGMLRGR